VLRGLLELHRVGARSARAMGVTPGDRDSCPHPQGSWVGPGTALLREARSDPYGRRIEDHGVGGLMPSSTSQTKRAAHLGVSSGIYARPSTPEGGRS
jgi:hypothetical protein